MQREKTETKREEERKGEKQRERKMGKGEKKRKRVKREKGKMYPRCLISRNAHNYRFIGRKAQNLKKLPPRTSRNTLIIIRAPVGADKGCNAMGSNCDNQTHVFLCTSLSSFVYKFAKNCFFLLLHNKFSQSMAKPKGSPPYRNFRTWSQNGVGRRSFESYAFP